jgi:hypothetical protein
MKLPSSICGSTTETIGLFQCDARRLAPWLAHRLGKEWGVRSVAPESIEALGSSLAPGAPLTRHALIPWGGWTALLTDGPLGTDVGMLPSLAARELGCVAMRATSVDSESGRFGAVVLEVFDPAASGDVLRCRRSIAAADDGGRWVLNQAGEPFEFEQLDAYSRGRIRDRFTAAMLDDYLRALGVTTGAELELGETVLVEKI